MLKLTSKRNPEKAAKNLDKFFFSMFTSLGGCFQKSGKAMAVTVSQWETRSQGEGNGGNSPPIPKFAPKILRLLKRLMGKPQKYFTAN